MKKALLASTALVGAALLSAPAYAGSVGSGDNLAVRLSGFMWFHANVLDEDNQTGYGRGYRFKIPESEVHVNASNTADNGIKYGVSIEFNANADDGTATDEVWAFLSGDFGRLEMGDNDDASNRMLVGAFQAHNGLSGPLGGLGGLAPAFHNQFPTNLSRTDWQPASSGDAAKIIYITPRFSGFQVAASFTPDSGQNGADWTELDNDGSYENMIGLGVRYAGKFDNVGISASVAYERAKNDPVTSAGSINDLEYLHIGAKVDFGGFVVGANWRDNNNSQVTDANEALGDEGGTYWAAAVGYSQGPWGVSGWLSNGEKDNGTSTAESKTTVDRWGVGGRYAIAPGWQIRADYNVVVIDNAAGAATDNTATAFMLTNMFNF